MSIRDLTDLKAKCDDLTDQHVAEQGIGWLPQMWVDLAKESPVPIGHVVDALLAEWHETGTIRRSFVAGFDEPLSLFVASMAWGFGDDPRGPFRTARMLNTDRDPDRGPLDVISDIVERSRAEGADAFGALWRDGRSRVMGLGTAFGTKLLYFAGRDRPSQRRPGAVEPLILDLNVWKGSRELLDAPVPDLRRYCTTDAYRAYCDWAANAVPNRSGDVVKVGSGPLPNWRR